MKEYFELYGIETREGEQWKQLDGIAAWVSNFGRFVKTWNNPSRSLGRVFYGYPYEPSQRRVGRVTHKYWAVVVGKWKRLKAGRTQEFVHRLVAAAFVENPRGLNEVHHIDGNVLNNHYLNLQWVTHAENMAFCRGASRKSRDGSLMVAIKPEMEKEVLDMRASGATHKEIAARFSISTAPVSHFLKKHGLGCFQRSGRRGKLLKVNNLPRSWRHIAAKQAACPPL